MVSSHPSFVPCIAPLSPPRNATLSSFCIFQRRHSFPKSTPRTRAVVHMKKKLPVPLAPKTSDVWELDFYSRPVVGLDGKKLWELILTDSEANFEHVEAIPNSLVNSIELRKRVQAVIDNAPSKPTSIRFFRSQMLNMIQIALAEIDVIVSPSRKTYALYQILKEREKRVYVKMPGFRKSLSRKATSFKGIDLSIAQRLPDALRCDSFAFGTFPLGQLEEFFASAIPNEYFGDRCFIDSKIAKDTMVPGLIILSRRAHALAAWLSGIELAFVKGTLEKQQVVFECGLTTVYKFAQITSDLKDDVRSFEAGKDAAGGMHFVAIQKSQESEEVEGMWLLCESV